MEILESLSGVFSCMLMIGLGYFLTMRGWFNKETGLLFSKLAMTITIPLYMIVSMMKSYTRADLMQLGIAVVMPCFTAYSLMSKDEARLTIKSRMASSTNKVSKTPIRPLYPV